MSEPRVAWILCSNRWNSAITEYALSTARALRLCGWDVFFSGLVNSPAERRAREYDLPGDSFASFGLKEIGRLRRLCRNMKPDALFLFGGPETFLARFVPGVLRIRFRGQDRDMTEELSPWKNRLNMQACAAILVPARALEQRFLPFWNRTIRPIMLGVDTSRFAFHPEAFAVSRRPTLRIVGRLDPIKGHQFFFGLYRRLLLVWPKDRPQPFLEIIGQGANMSPEQLRLMAAELNLREGKDWALRSERVGNLSELMSATDLGVIPSLGSEVIGRVAEEFLLCGVPLFLSGVGALEDCLIEPSFGTSYRRLNESETVQQLALTLQKAVDEREAQRCQRASAAAVFFSLERMGADLQLMLDELLSGDPNG